MWAAVAAAVVLVAALLALAMHETQADWRSDGTKRTPLPIANRAYADSASISEDEATDPGDEDKAKDSKDKAKESKSDDKAKDGSSESGSKEAGSSAAATSGNGSSPSGGSSASSSSGSSTSSGGSSSSSQSQKKWVEDTSQVWVVDQAAWDEQVPVYGQVGHTVCNYCGADISNNYDEHTKAHVMANGTTAGTGWHEEFTTEVTGYETVHHDEQGHYETVVTGGHWE